MSKIICEICGTVYPDNATTCPICGYPRNDAQGETVETEEAAAAAAGEKVRGGKFSNTNVKKRQAAQSGDGAKARRNVPEEEPAKDNGNKGLLITIAVLLAAVIFVGAYIGIRFFRGASAYDKATEPPVETQATQATEATQPTETEPAEIKCTGIQVPDIDPGEGVEFLGEGRSWRLKVTVEPADTTDELVITSGDETVAQVSMSGEWVEVLSVGAGETEITIVCGEQSLVFPVLCSFGEETEETTEATEETTEPTEETTEPIVESGTLNLNRSDITFSHKGETFQFSAGSDVPLNQVTWTSGNEKVVTIENGKAVAVGPGTTEITAAYGTQKETCIIRCAFAADPDDTEPTEETEVTEPSETTEPTEETTEPTEGGEEDTTWKLSHTDVTIAVGESFQLTLYNSDYEIADVTLSTGSTGISISGYDITGVTSGSYNTVTVTYNGQTYTCIVRVK